MDDDQDALFGLPVPQLDRALSDLASDGQIRRRRNRFVVYPSPTTSMSSKAKFPMSKHPTATPPQDLHKFVTWFETIESGRERFRWVLRDSLDELMDGQRTGRWCYQHLSKTEKAHLGTVVEVNLTKEFAIPDGDDLDWRIGDEDLDCKFSKDLRGWEIPTEMYICGAHGDRSAKRNHPALLVWMNDDASQWAAGFIRCSDENLSWGRPKPGKDIERAYNKDFKRKIAATAMPDIYWLWGGLQRDLPVNTLLHMNALKRSRILAEKKSGQQRVNTLFREIQHQIVRRPIVVTVAQQDDAPKRVRDARKALARECILILGHQESDPIAARLLNLPVPVKGEWISARLVAVSVAAMRPKVFFDDDYWAVARDDELGEPDDDYPFAPLPKKLPDQQNPPEDDSRPPRITIDEYREDYE